MIIFDTMVLCGGYVNNVYNFYSNIIDIRIYEMTRSAPLWIVALFFLIGIITLCLIFFYGFSRTYLFAFEALCAPIAFGLYIESAFFIRCAKIVAKINVVVFILISLLMFFPLGKASAQQNFSSVLGTIFFIASMFFLMANNKLVGVGTLNWIVNFFSIDYWWGSVKENKMILLLFYIFVMWLFFMPFINIKFFLEKPTAEDLKTIEGVVKLEKIGSRGRGSSYTKILIKDKMSGFVYQYDCGFWDRKSCLSSSDIYLVKKNSQAEIEYFSINAGAYSIFAQKNHSKSIPIKIVIDNKVVMNYSIEEVWQEEYKSTITLMKIGFYCGFFVFILMAWHTKMTRIKLARASAQ